MPLCEGNKKKTLYPLNTYINKSYIFSYLKKTNDILLIFEIRTFFAASIKKIVYTYIIKNTFITGGPV